MLGCIGKVMKKESEYIIMPLFKSIACPYPEYQ